MKPNAFALTVPSQIYRELARLNDEGLIEASDKGVRDQLPYTITERGRAAFLDWLHEVPGPEIIRSPLHLKLSFAEDLDATTCARFVQIHRLRNEERLAYIVGSRRPSKIAGRARPRCCGSGLYSGRVS